MMINICKNYLVPLLLLAQASVSIAVPQARTAEPASPVLFPITNFIELRNNVDTEQNNIELISSVIYSNGCYSQHHNSAEVYLESKKIYLFHYISKSSGFCTMALVYNEPSFLVQPLPPGQYSLVDGYSGDLIHILEVRW